MSVEGGGGWCDQKLLAVVRKLVHFYFVCSMVDHVGKECFSFAMAAGAAP